MNDIFGAARTGDVAAVTALLEAEPATARLRDERGLTPLMVAAYNRQQEVLALLLGYAASDLDIFEASTVGLELRMTELIAADASCVFSYSSDGFTPLHLAAFFAQEGAVKTLLAHGADPNAVARNDMRVAPLHSAVAAGQHRIAGELIAAGADVNARQQGGFTPLHGAAFGGDPAIVNLLLASGADMALQTDDGKTASDIARDQGHRDAALSLQR